MELGWIDFSKTDRDKVLDVLDLLGENGTLDELGIAPIRDGYSKRFFPGTSTVQKRAKYFFIIPYIFKDLELKTEEITVDDLKMAEKECAFNLLTKYPKESGIIGKRSLNNKNWVQRTPSSIYWSGLQKYGIIAPKISIDEFIDNLNSLKNNADYSDSQNANTGHNIILENNISYSINEIYDENWSSNLDINLTPKEGEILKEHIISSCGKSLFAYLLRDVEESDLQEVVKCKSFSELKSKIDIPEKFKENYENAIAFSDFMYVLTVIYNGFVLNLHFEEAREFLSNTNLKEASKVNIDELMSSLKLKDEKLKEFLNDCKQAMENNDEEELKRIIIERESFLKGEKAKHLHTDDLKSDAWFGRKLDYRFSNAIIIIDDILKSKNNLSGGEQHVES